jgi:hypothetical protein
MIHGYFHHSDIPGKHRYSQATSKRIPRQLLVRDWLREPLLIEQLFDESTLDTFARAKSDRRVRSIAAFFILESAASDNGKARNKRVALLSGINVEQIDRVME